jgi:type IV pilus assembly protein PilE
MDQMMMNRRHGSCHALASASGFTLIEVMITLAIIAILASIAYPSYTSYVAKGNRAEGRAAVMRMLQDQERWFTQKNTYVAIDQTAGTAVLKNFSGDSRTTSKYWVGATACGATPITQCINVIAVPQFGGGDPLVGTLSSQSTGSRSCTGTKTDLCWPS